MTQSVVGVLDDQPGLEVLIPDLAQPAESYQLSGLIREEAREMINILRSYVVYREEL